MSQRRTIPMLWWRVSSLMEPLRISVTSSVIWSRGMRLGWSWLTLCQTFQGLRTLSSIFVQVFGRYKIWTSHTCTCSSLHNDFKFRIQIFLVWSKAALLASHFTIDTFWIPKPSFFDWFWAKAWWMPRFLRNLVWLVTEIWDEKVVSESSQSSRCTWKCVAPGWLSVAAVAIVTQ